jgi:Methyltransferase domain
MKHEEMTSRLRQVWSSVVRGTASKPVGNRVRSDTERNGRTASLESRHSTGSGARPATESQVSRAAAGSARPDEQQGTAGGAGPDLQSFTLFLNELQDSFPARKYHWSKGKERSCRWLLSRVPAGAVGVDVGGTEYLCRKLSEKGCNVTYFDLVPPATYDNHVQDDMFNILRHFPERSLDFITTRHTLEHSLVPLYQLWAYNRLLKDDGKLLVIVPMPNKHWVWFTTHFSCLPYENWLMLFYRTGYKIEECDAGTWGAGRSDFVEFRFALSVETRQLRLTGKR